MSATSGAASLRGKPQRWPSQKLPAWAVLARRAALDARTRTIAFACLFAVVAYINPATYRATYPTVASRIAFAHSFGNNKAVVLFYGKAYNLISVGGYAAWRSGGTLAIFAAVFGVFAAVRALRTEEETGRAELVLSGLVGRMTAFGSSLAAIGAGTLVLFVAELAGLLAAGLPVGGSALLALATTSVVSVFVGAGALASQLAPTRRMALQLGFGAVVVAFLLRVIADTSDIGWLRWATPLGWAEEVRPFTGAHPGVLLLPLAVSAILLFVAARIQAGRDIGAGVLPSRDSSEPRLYLLSSPTAQALREERTTLLVWTFGIGAVALIIGIVSKSINASVISQGLQKQFAKLGEPSVVTPVGYIAFAFIFVALALSLFACAQVAAARHEEAEERLETLLAQPVGRRSWLGGRLGVAVAAAVVMCLTAGVLTWTGAQTGGVHLSLLKLLEAGANCLPTFFLFLGLSALAYALVPRASTGIAYGLVAVAFLWYLFGSLADVPHWLIEATPFAHIAAVPVQSFRVGAAAVMVGAGVAATMIALFVFRRRDLIGA